MFHRLKRAAEGITHKFEAEVVLTKIIKSDLSASQKRELTRILEEKKARCIY